MWNAGWVRQVSKTARQRFLTILGGLPTGINTSTSIFERQQPFKQYCTLRRLDGGKPL
jgi:hypothetical protein